MENNQMEKIENSIEEMHDEHCECEECSAEQTLQLTNVAQIAMLSPTGTQVLTYAGENFVPDEVLQGFDGFIENKVAVLQNLHSLISFENEGKADEIEALIKNAEGFLRTAGIWQEAYEKMNTMLPNNRALYAAMLLFDIDNYCDETIKWCQLWSQAAGDEEQIDDDELMNIVNSVLNGDSEEVHEDENCDTQ